MDLPFSKEIRIESKKYLKWIREQPCVICGDMAEPHHLRSVRLGTGTGRKACDILTIPVCREHHNQCHDTTIDPLTQAIWCLKTIQKAVRLGVIKL